MTRDDMTFSDAFSAFLERSGRWRDTEPDALLARWADFVDACERGYQGDAQDYFNDLTARDSLDRAMKAAELQAFPELPDFCARVGSVDSRFRSIIDPDAFPRIDEKFWWSRGVVRYGRKRFVEDLRREYHLEIEEVD